MVTSESERREHVVPLLRRYRALLILSKSITREDLERLDRVIADVPTYTAAELAQTAAFYGAAWEKLTQDVDLIADPDLLVGVVADTRMGPLFDTFFPAKIHIETKWFRDLSRGRVSNWDLLPPHTRIGIDLNAQSLEYERVWEWRLLEASLFEDVALLWNEIVDCGVTARPTIPLADDRIAPKRIGVLTRSVVRGAFALLEAYMNDLAVDIVETRADLTPQERELLEEVRGDDKKLAPMSLRDKLLKYPRIALRREHPVINEGNCPPMVEVLALERRYRDSLMHPTMRSDVGREPARENIFYDVSIDDARRIIDTVVAMIERVDHELDGLFGRASVWLAKRAADDRYPNATFW